MEGPAFPDNFIAINKYNEIIHTELRNTELCTRKRMGGWSSAPFGPFTLSVNIYLETYLHTTHRTWMLNPHITWYPEKNKNKKITSLLYVSP